MRPKDVKSVLESNGAPRMLELTEMIGKGLTIIEIGKARRDSRGSPGRIYKVSRSDGTTSSEFVHNINRNTMCWR